MLPLVRRILRDLVHGQEEVRTAQGKIQLLEGCERSSQYEVRRQCVQAREAWQVAGRDCELAVRELESLGLVVLDEEQGIIGFPFRWTANRKSRRVRRAFFLYKASDPVNATIRAWRFENELRERPIPPHWLGQLQLPLSESLIEAT